MKELILIFLALLPLCAARIVDRSLTGERSVRQLLLLARDKYYGEYEGIMPLARGLHARASMTKKENGEYEDMPLARGLHARASITKKQNGDEDFRLDRGLHARYSITKKHGGEDLTSRLSLTKKQNENADFLLDRGLPARGSVTKEENLNNAVFQSERGLRARWSVTKQRKEAGEKSLFAKKLKARDSLTKKDKENEGDFLSALRRHARLSVTRKDYGHSERSLLARAPHVRASVTRKENRELEIGPNKDCARLVNAWEMVKYAVRNSDYSELLDQMAEQIMSMHGVDIHNPYMITRSFCSMAGVHDLQDLSKFINYDLAAVRAEYPDVVSSLNAGREAWNRAVYSPYIQPKDKQILQAIIDFFDEIEGVGLFDLN